MLFFYIRHGHPIYSPDSLTPLGERQAEAVAKRLALYGIDKVYSSTSNRAKLTAKPTCELLCKEPELLDFANEGHAWKQLGCWADEEKTKWTWLIDVPKMRRFLCDPEVVKLGHNWYDHPKFAEYDYKKGIDRVRTESDKLFASLGYEHIPGTGMYKATNPNNDRVALFAHAGFGLTFLSCILDIPYPQFAIHFDICHSGMTVINFGDNGEGYSIPRIMTYSNDSHLYREGIMTGYNNGIRF
ncbi:MAG: histidine phosphatase family protein [Ruminococcaceae bacterium]|nr:histidine phosphatase family protein [Oscillospiraceae bacterium]